jgi:hypothetical protein
MSVLDSCDETRFGPLSCDSCDTGQGTHRDDCPDFEPERYPPPGKYRLTPGQAKAKLDVEVTE